MIDFPSVHVSGSVNIGRARVLWHEGQMRMYTRDGLVETIRATQPVALTNWWRSWGVNTSKGLIKLRARCTTCGGWRKVTRVKAEELWMV